MVERRPEKAGVGSSILPLGMDSTRPARQSLAGLAHHDEGDFALSGVEGPLGTVLFAIFQIYC